MDPTWLSPALQRGYEQQWQTLPNARGGYVQTLSGPVWVAEAGPEDAPPVLALHGMHTPAPFNLELFWPLTEHFRVISPDLPGQAGKTLGLPTALGQGMYALWLKQLLDQLEIEQCPMVGLSFGGALILDLASVAPERITCASLVVPAGFFRPLLRPLTKLFMPLLGFKFNSDRPHFDALMQPLMADNWPELEAYYYAVFQAGIPMTIMPPGPYDTAELKGFNAPCQLFIAEQDVYFAPDKLARKAQQVLPNLQAVHRIDDLHVPNAQNRAFIQQQTAAFLRQQQGL